MADPGDEKNGKQKGLMGAAPKNAGHNESKTEEPSETESSSPDEPDDGEPNSEKQPTKTRPAAVRSQTGTTEASTSSRPTPTETKLPLSKRLNPLKRNPPPIPEERVVSREYHANFLSKLTFQWISPIMAVGFSFGAEIPPTNVATGRLLQATRTQRLIPSKPE